MKCLVGLIISVGNVSSLVLALSHSLSFSLSLSLSKYFFFFFVAIFMAALRQNLAWHSWLLSQRKKLSKSTISKRDPPPLFPFCCCLRLPQISRQVGQYENVFIAEWLQGPLKSSTAIFPSIWKLLYSWLLKSSF